MTTTGKFSVDHNGWTIMIEGSGVSAIHRALGARYMFGAEKVATFREYPELCQILGRLMQTLPLLGKEANNGKLAEVVTLQDNKATDGRFGGMAPELD